MNKPIIFFACFTLILNSGLVPAQSQDADRQDEIQVLIDVSGSMKHNDPQNLRIDASKLLISLLPEKSNATIWLFAENTSVLTHSDAVDPVWKNKALKSTANIHSRGLYTNIEEALQTALKSGYQKQGSKHLLILTDGFVDTSKDIMVSADSRERILSEWIPKFQQQHIKILTIALSDQADRELLEKLALDTGGWTLTANSADELQRAFLKMALKAAPKDSIPLMGNKFLVDNGVKEFSVLVFKQAHSIPRRLFSPDQKPIDKQSKLSNVAWLENAAYDLITVKQPAVGEWRIEAETDPDNQVMIVTDLKLQMADTSNFFDEKESIVLKMFFTDQEKLITRSDFLSVITVSVSLDQQAAIILQPLAGQAGYYGYVFNELSTGKHNLTILADGKTFKREIVKEIEVVATPIKIEQQMLQDQRGVILKLIPNLALLDASTLAVEASINRAGKPVETVRIENKEGAWSIKLADLPPGTETILNFNVLAKSLNGKSISPVIKPIKIDDTWFAPSALPAVSEPAHADQDTRLAETEHTEDKADQQPEKSTDWILVASIVIGVNLLLIGSGYFIYRAVKKANEAKQHNILEKLS